MAYSKKYRRAKSQLTNSLILLRFVLGLRREFYSVIKTSKLFDFIFLLAYDVLILLLPYRLKKSVELKEGNYEIHEYLTGNFFPPECLQLFIGIKYAAIAASLFVIYKLLAIYLYLFTYLRYRTNCPRGVH